MTYCGNFVIIFISTVEGKVALLVFSKGVIEMRKKTLKFICAALVAVMCLSVFVGCSDDEQEARLAELSDALSAAADEISALKGEVSVLRDENEAAEDRIDSLTGSVEAADREINLLEGALAESNGALAEKGEELSGLSDRLTTAEALLQRQEEQMLFGESYITVGETEITLENYRDIFGDGGSVSYDPVVKALVLKDAVLSLSGGFVWATDDLSIELVGESKITVTGGDGEDLYGIACRNGKSSYDLRIYGEGSLAIEILTAENTSSAVGIIADDFVVESGKLALGVGTATEESIGAYLEGNMFVYGAEVSISALKGAQKCYDILCLGSVQLHSPIAFEAISVFALGGVWDNDGYPNDPTKKIKIYIDQGHNPSSFHNSGAQGNGLHEEDLTYKIGIALFELLRADRRFEVAVSRPTPQTVLGSDNTSSLAARVEGAESFGADYFISLHANAYSSADVKGAEAWVAGSEGESYGFAAAVLGGLVEETGQRNRSVKTNSELYVLKNATMPAVLLEMGFITNPDEAAMMDSSPELIAGGIYNGIVNYLGFN